MIAVEETTQPLPHLRIVQRTQRREVTFEPLLSRVRPPTRGVAQASAPGLAVSLLIIALNTFMEQAHAKAVFLYAMALLDDRPAPLTDPLAHVRALFLLADNPDALEAVQVFCHSANRPDCATLLGMRARRLHRWR